MDNIPDFQSIMLPLLEFMKDKQEHSTRETIDYISDWFKLTNEDRKEIYPSGIVIIDNKVSFAKTYLSKAGFLESKKRSYFNITELGLNTLEKKPDKINIKFLENFSSFVEWRNLKKEKKSYKEVENNTTQTPQEILEYNYKSIKDDLAQELLSNIKNNSPIFFEKLVVELLLSMGYGGSQQDAGQVVGQSGDGGIDGIIKEDKLGLDVIYIQAKRWEHHVPSREVRNFVGSLAVKQTNKGVFITTSRFTKDATNYVKSIKDKVVILIDGEMLSNLMIENNIGVSKVSSYDIKKIDFDYFDE